MKKETYRGSQAIDLRTLRVQEILDGESEDRNLIKKLQEEVRNANIALEAKNKALETKDLEIRRLNSELGSKNTPKMPGDPDGYYRALGLHPTITQELTKDETIKLVKSHFTAYSRTFHTDHGGGLERMKKINAARDFFIPKPKQDFIPKEKPGHS